MGPLLALLLMLCIAVLWLFFKFPPETPLAHVLKLVNRLFLGLAFVLAVVAMGRVFSVYANPFGDPMVIQLASVLGLMAVVVVLGLGFILRNFVIFRTPRY